MAGKLADEILVELRKKKGAKAMDDGDPEDKADGGADEETEGDSYGGDEVEVIKELRTALDDGDDQAAAEALRSFVKLCTKSSEE